MKIFKTNSFLKSVKRTLQGISTVLKVHGFAGKQYGYYIPYPYAPDVSSPADLYPLKSVKNILDRHLEDYKKLCDYTIQYNNILENFAKGNKYSTLAPRFNQDWFTGLDGSFTYSIVRLLKPKKIIEIGSGFSTRFLSRPVKDAGLDTALISINPKKLHGADKLCDKYYQCTLDKAPKEIFEDLQAGDILFIDASHLFMPGTDLELLFLDIIPNLKEGVYIQFHDIFLPDNYPDDPDWNWWSFNEQSYLAALLIGGNFTPIMPVAYLAKYHKDMLSGIFAPKHPRGHQSSFWLVRGGQNKL